MKCIITILQLELNGGIMPSRNTAVIEGISVTAFKLQSDRNIKCMETLGHNVGARF